MLFSYARENEEMFSGHKQIEMKEEKKECVKSKSPRGKQLSLETFIDFPPSSIARDSSTRGGQQINSQREAEEEREMGK